MNGQHRNIDRALGLYPRARRVVPIKDEGVMAIHTGLSVTVCGHLIELERDEYNKVARLVVKVIEGHKVTGMEGSAVNAAARLLAQRAQRFLGQNWRIVPLPRMVETPAASA